MVQPLAAWIFVHEILKFLSAEQIQISDLVQLRIGHKTRMSPHLCLEPHSAK